MKKLIGNILLIVMLAIGVVSAFAAQHNPPIQQIAVKTTLMTGQVTQISDHNLTLKDQKGTLHTVKLSDPSMAQGIKSGDRVTVAFDNGKATSIKKVEAYAPAANDNKPM